MQTITDTDERLYRTVADVLGVDEAALTDGSSPETLAAWDSLSHLNLIMALEEEFDWNLSLNDTLQMYNIGAIRRLLDQSDAAQIDTISFADCTVNQVPALKAFIAKSYGENYVLGINDAYLNWQYRQTSDNDAGDYHLRLAMVDGRIVGCLGYIPVDFTIAGRVVRACWLANWMVDPDQRHLGLGPLLAREVSADYEVTLALGANQEAGDILRRMGWTDFGMLQRYVRILDMNGAAALTASGQLDWPAEASAGPQIRPADPSIKRVKHFDESATQLWDQTWGTRPLSAGTRRSSSFLNWRYAKHCQFDYQMFEARDGDQLVGLGVYRVEQARDLPLRVGRLVELIGQPGVDSLVLHTMIEDARRHGAVAIDYFCGGPEIEVLMTEHGFLPGEHPAAARIPVLYQPLDRSRAGIRFLADLQKVSDAAQLQRWYVSKADGDQDRPN